MAECRRQGTFGKGHVIIGTSNATLFACQLRVGGIYPASPDNIAGSPLALRSGGQELRILDQRINNLTV